ncbi:GNAT family N-acetyltransferase [Candidatus Aerophobetes bacterium]|uniref:GNAT family N-acetyltransferase n=1 Tax=Aerophobetes bacterium TaxID=2030807 RepID=A0A2A4YI38_UNCAE|nr:MAG: GNAT family N-acetyltransferase [Candidatus Aerophobetes bacterium]
MKPFLYLAAALFTLTGNCMSKENLTFTEANKSHEALIHTWLAKDHIKPYFYGDGLKNTLKNLELFVNGIDRNDDYSFKHFVAFCDGKPFGFIMTSPIDGPHSPDDPYDKWFIEGKKTMTLDLLIGEENLLGKGLGTQMIKEFIQSRDVDFVLIDPAVSNKRAIHVYEKAGFSQKEEFIPSFNPTPHVMMRLETTSTSH